MSRTNEHRCIDTLLEDAEVLTDEYDDYNAEAARRRIAHTLQTRRQRTAGPTAGNRYPAAADQAAHDLDLAVALIVGTPQAATSLERLVAAEQDIEPDGALVFAALLHLAGYREAAAFWWQFAAGAGNRNAAFCLFLAHRRRAEFKDAAHWRAQGRDLSGPGTRTRAELRALLPEKVRGDLLRQCRDGRHPALPAALEAVISRLPVDSADSDYGEIPQPVDGIVGDLVSTGWS